jgi:hypothetical protein
VTISKMDYTNTGITLIRHALGKADRGIPRSVRSCAHISVQKLPYPPRQGREKAWTRAANGLLFPTLGFGTAGRTRLEVGGMA